MLKLKYMLILLSPLFLMATTLRTSDHLDNLESVTDECAHVIIKKPVPVVKEAVVSIKTKEVETVSYSLQGCDGKASFPVTVRSNKKQEE